MSRGRDRAVGGDREDLHQTVVADQQAELAAGGERGHQHLIAAGLRTGLGLALVAEHAQAHGGEAWVDDRPGGGARFVATFGEAV